MMVVHILAMLIGFLLDMLFGDPDWLPHPVRLMGKIIAALDKLLGAKQQKRTEIHEKISGLLLVILTLLFTLAASAGILVLSYTLQPCLGLLAESIMTYQVLAMKGLKTESMKVYTELEKGDIKAARAALSMIVGRDTAALDEEGIAKAAIETVAENTSDGVIAPMLYTALLGPIGGFLYKAVNTMDSMIGYKNERYLYFGRAAAGLDDICNYIPARVSACFMILAAFSGRTFDGRHAYLIFKRDRYQHASPNSAQTESVCAGALHIQLAGDASYFGRPVKKPTIGDNLRPVEAEDIKRVNQLMYITAFLCQGSLLLLLGGIYLCMH